jgi:hypothetical protein
VPATSTQGRRQLTSEAPVCHRNRAGSRRAGESVLAAGRRLSPTLPVLLFKVSIGGTATGSGTLSGTQVAVLVTRTVASEYRSPEEPSENLRSLNFKSKVFKLLVERARLGGGRATTASYAPLLRRRFEHCAHHRRA